MHIGDDVSKCLTGLKSDTILEDTETKKKDGVSDLCLMSDNTLAALRPNENMVYLYKIHRR